MLARRVEAGLVDCRAPRLAVIIADHAEPLINLSGACHDDASGLALHDYWRRVADADVLLAGALAVHDSLSTP